MPRIGMIKIQDKAVEFTHLDRVIWKEGNLTKYDLIHYFLEVSSYLLPHLYNRFLVFQRFPKGTDKPGFYQKNCPQSAPSWVKKIPFQHGSRVIQYIVADGPETLAWLGNQASVEIHPWLSSLDALETPDYAVFDLDPADKTSPPQLRQAALTLNQVLLEMGLRGYPKTSGSRGIQVYVPLKPVYTYDRVRKFVETTFHLVYSRLPSYTTMERSKEKRRGKIYLDYLQNGRGKTLVAPYSPRPHPHAPVSTPLSWQEVENRSFPLSENIQTIPSRLQDKGDLFAPALDDRQKLPE